MSSECIRAAPSLTRIPVPLWWPSLVAQLVKNLPVEQDTWVRSLGWEDLLEKGKATHSSILAWRIPWTVQSMGSQRVGHAWVTFTFDGHGALRGSSFLGAWDPVYWVLETQSWAESYTRHQHCWVWGHHPDTWLWQVMSFLWSLMASFYSPPQCWEFSRPACSFPSRTAEMPLILIEKCTRTKLSKEKKKNCWKNFCVASSLLWEKDSEKS